jgi:hypothetical protein
MFKDSDTFDRTARHALLTKGVFSTGSDLSFLHPAPAETLFYGVHDDQQEAVSSVEMVLEQENQGFSANPMKTSWGPSSVG